MTNFLHEMSLDDKRRSYENSYVLDSGGRAVRIVEFYDDLVTIEDCLSKQMRVVKCEDLVLDIPDIGMIWWNNNLWYVSKVPERQWVRGFRQRSLVCYRLETTGNSIFSSSIPSGLFQAVLTNYMENNINKHDNIFSRDFARRGKVLFFRSVPVGLFMGNTLDLFFDLPLPEALSEWRITVNGKIQGINTANGG